MTLVQIRNLSIMVPMFIGLVATLITAGEGNAYARDQTPAQSTSTESCLTTAVGPIRPTEALISELNRAVGVVRVRRKRNGQIGTPPLTQRGKTQLGWDPNVQPGAGWGSVITDAHTWPDGSALGNAMLRDLREGATIVMRDQAGASVCYRITKRGSYPRNRIPRSRMFQPWGAEQLVIVVCSGRRLGPGNWLRRTVWWAEPVPAVAPAEPAT